MRAFLWLTALFLTLFSAPALAFDVEEFDDGYGEWEFSPQKIGRSTKDGWATVSNDGEKAARNSPTGTKYTYYWKLTRDVDLTKAIDPVLDAKLHFKGHGYDYAAVQIGPEGASRLSDFTTLVRFDEATEDPEVVAADLSEWAGQKVVLRVIMRKPYNVVEKKIGLYVHRIGVKVDTTVDDLPVEPELLSIGAFNIQVFGLTKMDKPDVPDVLVQVANRYDLLLVQEIRDKSQTAIHEYLDLINAQTDDPFEMQLSDRLGRTWSKEQYAYFYRPSKLTVLDSYHYDDGEEPDADLFQREPYIVQFQTTTGSTFAAIGLHSAPDEAQEEIDFLADVVEDATVRLEEEDLLLLGDFNAGCSYVRPSQIGGLLLYQDPLVDWWIGEEADTTTTSTVCPYDRILTTGELTTQTVEGSGGVFLFDHAFSLSPTLTRAVSDHYPVELLLDLNQVDEEEASPTR